MRSQLKNFSAMLVGALLLLPSLALAQAKAPRDFKVAYPLGGSTSFFWVAHKPADMLDFSFLKKLEEERKARGR